jgi:hypothetical protein
MTLAYAPRRYAAPTPPQSGLAAVLNGIDDTIDRHSTRDSVPLAVVLSAVGRRSYGPLLLIMGVFAVSPLTVVPGLTALTALVIFAIALQMAIGARRPWLPRRMLTINVPRRPLFKLLDKVRPHVDRVDGRWLRPRFEFLCDGPCALLIAACVAAAALITLPLSLVPFGPVLPSLAIILFGLGMTTRDGLLVGGGIALMAAAGWLAAPLIPHVL